MHLAPTTASSPILSGEGIDGIDGIDGIYGMDSFPLLISIWLWIQTDFSVSSLVLVLHLNEAARN